MSKRNGMVDLFKFIFAVVIAIFHGGTNLWYGAKGEYPMSGGAIGVEFFFIVSGYLMVSSESRRSETRLSLHDDTFSFIKGKVKSLCPGFFISWALAFFFTNWSENLNEGVDLFTLFKRTSYSVFELLMVNQSGLNVYRVNHATWYVSSMLIGMVILYPLLAKKREWFLKVIAPFAAIMIFGYMYARYSEGSGFGGPADFDGFMLKGTERGIACMCVGAVCWNIVDKIKGVEFTKFGRLVLTLLEGGGYLYVLMFAYFMRHSAMDYVCVFVLAVAITISFSNKSYFVIGSLGNVTAFLGEWSLYIFLNNSYWSHTIPNLYPDVPYKDTIGIYMACVIGSSFVVMMVSRFLLKRSGRIFGVIRKCFLVDSDEKKY